MEDEGIIAEALEVVEIAAVAHLPADSVFTEAERAYAHSKTDPERRPAARLAAKRAAQRLLGGDLALVSLEVLAGRGGPPRLKLHGEALARLRARGASAVLTSLTHGETHAAAAVALVR
jgi:holo-[acyl-carrier protein] synthase